MDKTEQVSKLCKIVYFDESSVTDYIQIVAGGRLEKTTELLNESNKTGKAGAAAKASIGLSSVLKALIGFEVSVSADASANASFNTSKMATNILKNTILTDFIDIIQKNNSEAEESISNAAVIRKFTGYTITAPKESLSFVALISPYLTMLKGGTAIPAGEFNISIEKLDNTIRSAKGYYEFIGSNDKGEPVIFRFNINSFKNNYKVTDLLKMDVSIFAIKVGTSSIGELDINNELKLNTLSMKKDNPTYQKEVSKDEADKSYLDKKMDVYDALLAGVESYDG